MSQLIKDVPNHLKNDSDLIYERMRWRRKAKLETAADFLFNPPKEISNVRGWWINSRIVIRRLINKKIFKSLPNSKKPYTSNKYRIWLRGRVAWGWIAFSFINKKEESIKHFEKVYEFGGMITRLRQLFGWV